ncbi:ATP-binding protein, partial [Bradyrhizobium sp. PRIMUS42]
LSIVRAVADDHAATVAVANLPGGGAEFTLRFRRADKVKAGEDLVRP